MTKRHRPAWSIPTAELSTLEKEITGAGREVLDRHIRDYRSRIVREAVSSRSNRTPGRIGVSEVQYAISRIRSADKVMPRAAAELLRELSRPAIVLAFTLVAVTVAGLGLVGVFATDVDSAKVFVSVAFGVLGSVLTMVLALFFFELLRAQRWRVEHETLVMSREFVRRMAEMEDRLVALAASLTGVDDVRSLGLRGALAVLEEFRVWSPDDVVNYRNLLRLRNMIVHEDSLALDKNDLDLGGEELDRLDESLRVSGASKSSRKSVAADQI